MHADETESDDPGLTEKETIAKPCGIAFVDIGVDQVRVRGVLEIIEGIEPDPSVETVMRGAETMLKFEPDWIIAMGGGSPIDAAKAMWAFYEYPDVTFEELCIPFNFPE